MTEKEFLSLSPRERDALVAERVMQLSEHHIYRMSCTCGSGYEAPCREFRDGLSVKLPHYTTSIEAAWEVVERLRKDWWIDAEVLMAAVNVELEHRGTDVTVLAQADTAPLAIGLAALRAVGVVE